MGIVAKACWRLTLSLGWSVRAEAACLRAGPVIEGCAPQLRQSRGRKGRHSRLERLIGSVCRCRHRCPQD